MFYRLALCLELQSTNGQQASGVLSPTPRYIFFSPCALNPTSVHKPGDKTLHCRERRLVMAESGRAGARQRSQEC